LLVSFEQSLTKCVTYWYEVHYIFPQCTVQVISIIWPCFEVLL